ncbi:MAG: hypothetical protein HYS32_02885 [Candidatus Woesearchaeota archaeon]|nr:MAG: hypothetical protein HYS32_02885 [Candidatus Woesearchaeota archaeon]
MELKRDHLLAIVFFIVLIAIFISDPDYTSYAVGSNTTNTTNQTNLTPDLIITFDKQLFTQGELLNGNIKLKLKKGRLASNSKITVSINNQSVEKSLVEIIKGLNIQHKELQTVYTGSNPASSKALTFNSAGFKIVGVKVRRGANVESFNLKIKGEEVSGSFPTYPKIDISSKTFYNDWEFFGPLGGYDTNSLTGEGLEQTTPEELVTITNSPQVQYCEKVELPRSRAFRLSAKYQKLNLGLGDMKLRIRDADSDLVIGECDAPEDTTLSFQSCDIVLNAPIEGEEFICLYSSKDTSLTGLAKISTDPGTTQAKPTSTGYNCDEDKCELATPSDYYIRVHPGIYSKKLNTTESFAAWENSEDIALLSFNAFLGTCEPFDFSKVFCIVPIKVTSDSAGKITLSNLSLVYKKDGVSYSPVTELEDVSFDQALIELEKDTDVNIPISTFTLFAPSKGRGILKVATTIGLSGEKSFEIESPESLITLDPIASAENKIKVAKNTLLRLNQDELTAALGLSEASLSRIDDLTKFETIIKGIKEATNLTELQKKEKIAEVNVQIDATINNTPKSYSTRFKFEFEPSSIDIDELTSEVSLNAGDSHKKALSILQNKITITSEARLVDVNYFSGERSIVTTIKRTITPKTAATNVGFIEKIPKSMAKTAAEVGSSLKPTILKDDPIIKFSFAEISPENPAVYIYSTKGDSFNKVEEIEVLYIPSEISNEIVGVDCGNNFCNYLEDFTSCPEDCLCGNNICDSGEQATCPSDCKEFPWMLLISIIILLAIAAYGIYLYRNPDKAEKLSSIFKKKEKGLFKSDEQFKSLQNYIKNSISKGYKKQQIEQALLSKGWSKYQIEEAFSALSKTK